MQRGGLEVLAKVLQSSRFKWHLEQCPPNAPTSNGTKFRIGFTQQYLLDLSSILMHTSTLNWVHRSLRPSQSGCRRMQLQRDKSSRSSWGQRFFSLWNNDDDKGVYRTVYHKHVFFFFFIGKRMINNQDLGVHYFLTSLQSLVHPILKD